MRPPSWRLVEVEREGGGVREPELRPRGEGEAVTVPEKHKIH
jgi:hypothetical protein